MAGVDNSDATLERLRRLAAYDPKEARVEFQRLVQPPSELLDQVLDGASQPGDGRLRQVIATAYRLDPQSVLEPWLRRWLATEQDEFTRSAVASALSSGGNDDRRPSRFNRADSQNIVEAYRYVADRLCHRVRNALALPSAELIRLQQIVDAIGDAQKRDALAEIAGNIESALYRIARVVEFDTGDGYVQWGVFPLIRWLEATSKTLVARNGDLDFGVVCDPTVRQATVRATPLLLETILANLWSNAQQAGGEGARLEIQCALTVDREWLTMLALDAGSGFSENDLETAFRQAFSTKSPARGRGLLEIGDAVTRLQGRVQLVRLKPGEYRVELSLPVASL